MDTLTQHLPGIASVLIAASIALTSPGPNFVAITSSAVQSRRHGLYVAFGISFGTGLWALFATTGISAMLNTYTKIALALSVAGALYLCWLGIKSLKSLTESRVVSSTTKTAAIEKSDLLHSLKKGLLIQLTNPKSALFWLAITSIAIVPNSPLLVIAILVIGSFLIALIWHFILAIVFSSGPAQKAYLSMKPVFSLLFGVIFILLGMNVLYRTILAG